MLTIFFLVKVNEGEVKVFEDGSIVKVIVKNHARNQIFS